MAEPLNLMRYIWDKVSVATSKGEPYIKYQNRESLEFLYNVGFADTDKHTLKEWIEAFKDSLQKDGSYLLFEKQWMAKRDFIFSGVVNPPFNPMSLKDGELKKSEFEKLIEDRLLPSLSLEKSAAKKILQDIKKNSSQNTEVKIDQRLKVALQRILDLYPSPRYLRECRIMNEKPASPEKSAIAGSKAIQTLQHSSSSFAIGSSKTQTTLDQLNKLLLKK